MVRIGTWITLNTGEQAICHVIAQGRYHAARTAHVPNAKVGDQSNELTDLNGFGAELAFCRAFNVCPDFSLQARSSILGDDLDADASVFGIPIDVKSTVLLHGRLIGAIKKHPLRHCAYVLLVGSFPRYCFRGGMLADELMQAARLGTLKRACYLAAQHELYEMDDLVQQAGGNFPLCTVALRTPLSNLRTTLPDARTLGCEASKSLHP